MKSWILFLLLCVAPLCSGAAADPLYIVVLQPAKVGEPAFDVTKHGGTLEHRAGSRLAVRLPETAVDEVKQNPLVRYMQKLVAGEAVRLAASSHDRLAAHASVSANSITSVTHGPYTYDGAGNVRAIGPTSQPNQVYSYDRVGRLATARMYSGGTLYQQSFTYDAPGNMTSATLDGLVTPLPVDGNTNRLAAASGFTYDATGNMTASPMSGSYTYDQLGMLKADASTPYTNVFTPSDERLAVITTSGSPRWRWTLRDLSNQRVRDFESFGPTGTEYFEWLEDTYHDGARVMATVRHTAEGGTRHFHLDHLGTPRLTTNEEGREISRHDQLPYGVELTSLRQERDRGYTREQVARFTGHERDYLELTSADDHTVYLDYMHARTYNPNWGRFLSVDPTWESADLGKPQSWNRYAYVLNNPINAVDPDGRNFFLLPPTMPFHLGLNHPKNERVQKIEKAAVAIGVIVLAVIATKGDTLFAPSAEESAPTARQIADQQQAQGQRGGTAGTLTTPDGNTYSDTSGGDKQLHPDVQRALDNVPQEQRSAFHGRCAEPGCISKSLEGGSNPAGGVIDTAKMRGPNSPHHGESHEPCSTCKWILDFFGIKYERK